MQNYVNRLYKDLAWLWPIWGEIEEYKAESEIFIKLIKKFAKLEVNSLLDIGCGAGKNVYYFKNHFEVTGMDISVAMVSQAKSLNPSCHFHIRDMRNFDLNEQFDAIFLNDSILYMRKEEDLIKAFENACKHLKPGGVLISYMEVSKESFKQNDTCVMTYNKNGLNVTAIENSFDPKTEDDTFETTFIYLIRRNGKLEIEHDFHILGLFSLDTWRKHLSSLGLEVHEEIHHIDKEDVPVFICVKPLQ
ncbi:MAG: class I SAM-dependent methyltransferase [Spirochaetales bacterium]|nr:class I SAM-dependent methyltransferase [Spirochaetales bacterium]